MSTESIVIRTGTDADREAVLALAPRQGIGRELMGAADTWARDHGLAHLTLHAGARNAGARNAGARNAGARNAGARNAGARAFYAALGFAEEEVRLTRPL
jgi:GNAT superfamily N-acetyltransferase